ncbi:MAG: helix-hairpin-helix domain-containing protein [Bacteroidia bacterium]|nr:helix-hairpin-helix domain-containing protein [Bacteroidia bacterium]
MKKIVRDFLTFNKRERNGVFVLVSIITILVLYLNVSGGFVKKEPADFSDFDEKVKQLDALKRKAAHSASKQTSEATPATVVSLDGDRFEFDPNTLGEKDWKRLGLPDKLIQTIQRFLSKGGRFHKKEDLKKIYGMKQELYSSLEAYVSIEKEISSSESMPFPAVFKEGKVESDRPSSKRLIDLNTADSALLTSIKGVGPFYAKNIIKHRNALGGFVSKEQLMEIWKLDEEKYITIEPYVFVDLSKVKKININTCEAKDLKLPYINWNMANAIVNYRKHHGKYKTLEEIKQTDLVDEKTYRKIVPYLVVE